MVLNETNRRGNGAQRRIMFGLRRASCLTRRSLNQLMLMTKPPLRIALPSGRHGSCTLVSSSKPKSIVKASQSQGSGTLMDKRHLKYGILDLQTRSFRKTPPRHILSPVLLMLITGIGKVGAILVGRKFRKLPPEKKAIYFAKAKKNRGYLYASLIACGVIGIAYYYEHIEEAPITKRRRFMAFSEEQMDVIADVGLALFLELYKQELVPATDPRHQRVFRIVQKLADANRDLLEKYGKGKQWTVSLIDYKDIVINALVLSSGGMFVSTGLLDLCDEEGPSDSALAIILAHELAHVLMSHAREESSFYRIFDILFIIPILILWSLIPSDVLAVLLHWLMGKVSKILLVLPYSRKIETEADEVGLILAAKACFDVRECLIYKKMEIKSKQAGESEVAFLSTHPTNNRRYQHLQSKLEAALTLREQSGCPRLAFMDAAKRLTDYDNKLKQAKQNSIAHIAKPIKL